MRATHAHAPTRTVHAPYMYAHAPHAPTRTQHAHARTHTHIILCVPRTLPVEWSRCRLDVILPRLRKYFPYQVSVHDHTPGPASAIGLRNFYSSCRQRHCAAQHGVYYSFLLMIYYCFTLIISNQEFFRRMYHYFKPDEGSSAPLEPPEKIKPGLLEQPKVRNGHL